MKFVEFKKIPRLSREILVSEKIDGSNGQVAIASIETIKKEFLIESQAIVWMEQYCLASKDNLFIFAGSRNRWLQIGKQTDNHGFASWVKENAEELFQLGEGRHFGEWYGKGIQRGYGLDYKRFALFNVSKWVKKTSDCIPPLADKQQYCPDCCEVVPILYEGIFSTIAIEQTLDYLTLKGSQAVQGYMNPEGLVVFHTAAGQYFKKTLVGDDNPKGVTNG
jgi:hypothetical protein